MSFKNKRAVITGATSGIGRSIAEALSKEGSAVCLIGRRRETLEAMAGTVPFSAGSTLLFAADLGETADIESAAAYIRKNFGPLDILVHSAGVFSMGRVEDASVESFDAQYSVNLRAPYLLTKLLLPALKESGGQVVFVNSGAGLLAREGISQYAATKHGLKALADSLRDEVNASGVRVLSVYPGRTDTPMQQLVHRLEGRQYDPEFLLRAEDVAHSILCALSLPAGAEATDIRIRPSRKMG
jgi:NAD(P)-dependent dehydrogenase (short-subunit alcohol dehydrogenase family)